ncbi:MAG TPA: TadE/TadG family type IV pilus assembly protein [Pyrinomonadaceae bacterium]|nr:TadE/TadG family type IV pilus assembly protein [Pyrinomonadaceae bacterium]
MIKIRTFKDNERGAALVEFSIAATVFVMVLFAVIEFGRAAWTHNALADAARRGARYAVVNGTANEDNVKNVVVYGDPDGGTKPVVDGLTTDNVVVDYEGFGLDVGTVQVTIINYKFNFVVPVVGTKIDMPNYTTTLTGESAGTLPPTL